VSKFAAEYKLQQPSNFYTIGTPAGATGGNVSTMLPTIDGSFGIQNILGINQQLPTYFWSGPTADADFYASLFASLSSSENPPLVVAGSYFIAESDAGSQMIQRTNNELMKLCARGITFITTAGNTGAFNRNPTNLGTNTCSKMAPVFPASSPYATTVGLTTPSNQVPPRYGGKLGEIPVSGESAHGFTTGGGFSLVSPRPAYQDSQVRGYLKWLGDNGLNPSGMYDVNGRAYPDVSFVGYNYRAFVAGTKVARSGDPVPAFAGTIALINSALIDRNLPPLGFLNPLLYALGTRNEAFTQAGYPFYYDVSFGNNKCGLGFVDCCAQSFSAGPGWDAVSGLGTPYYINLIESILGLPNWAFATNTTTGPSPLRT
jgi:tripeptidyl-peptidase-1